MAGWWLPIAQLSLLCFAELAGTLASFLLFIAGEVWGLGSEAARSYGGPFGRGREGLWLSTKAPSRNSGLVSWGLHPSFHLLLRGPLSASGPVGGEYVQGTVLG